MSHLPLPGWQRQAQLGDGSMRFNTRTTETPSTPRLVNESYVTFSVPSVPWW